MIKTTKTITKIIHTYELEEPDINTLKDCLAYVSHRIRAHKKDTGARLKDVQRLQEEFGVVPKK